MKFHLSNTLRTAALFLCIAALSPASEIHANIDGRWVYHPAATLRSKYKDDQIHRIIDGNRYVYFSLHGLDSNYGTYFYGTVMKTKGLQLFRYDKQKSWTPGCIEAPGNQTEMAGHLHKALEYSPKWGAAVVVFDNFGISILNDDGSIINSMALTDAVKPARNMEAYSVTFDEDKPLAYISANSGFYTLDITNGELTDAAEFDKPVAWAGRVGSNMVVFAGDFNPKAYSTQTYVYPVGATPKTLDNPVTDGANMQVLMPLANNTFAALAPGSSDTQYILRIFHIDGNNVTSADALAAMSVDDAATANRRTMFSSDGIVTPVSEGFSLQNKSNIIMLKSGIDTETDASSIARFVSHAVATIPKSSLSTVEASSKASTANGTTLWLYTYNSNGQDESERGFYTRSFGGSEWNGASAVVAPNAPANGFPGTGKWHPEYGMLFRGPGIFFDPSSDEYDYFFGYKDGVWTDYSASARNKGAVALTLANKYIDIDPLNTDWIWSSAHYRGLNRINMKDFSDFFLIARTNSSFSGATIFKYFDHNTIGSGNLLALTNLDFDNDGNMWWGRFFVAEDSDNAYEEMKAQQTHIFYYTPEERRKMASAATNTSAFVEPHKIVINGAALYHYGKLLALKNPANSNILAIKSLYYYSDENPLIFYDTRGTLDDTSDDRTAMVRGILDETGNIFKYTLAHQLFEDEKTGEVWFCTSTGPLLIDPQDIMNGNIRGHRLKVSRKFGVDNPDFPFEHIAITGIDTDNLGRKWISTEQGLYCLSADNEELLAYYNTDNSSLPHDNITSVVCDQATGSVFALTEKGIAEFQPAGATSAVPEGEHLTVWPSTVPPYFVGYVNITGCQAGAEYVVCDSNGNEVCSLGRPENGILQWHPVNTDGQKVAAGKYNIRRKGSDETHPVIIAN